MHNGYINIDNKKMSKSAGNFFTVRDILKEFRGSAVRLFMLNAHYSNPINFSRELLKQAESAYDRILNCRANLKFVIANPKDAPADVQKAIDTVMEKFNAAMDDDLNTADAIGGIFEYVKELNTMFEDGGRAQDAPVSYTHLGKSKICGKVDCATHSCGQRYYRMPRERAAGRHDQPGV